MRFSQAELSVMFSKTTQAITMLLRGHPGEIEARAAKEGKRTIRRQIKTYGLDAVYILAVRTHQIKVYHDLCEAHGIQKVDLIVRRKESEFSDLLSAFIPQYEIFPQHRIGGYVVDFFVPKFKIAVEYDEGHHGKTLNIALDAARQKEIESAFGYRFIRVREGNEIAGLFDIAMAIFSQGSGNRS